MSSELKWTGERLVPSVLTEIAVEHLARYAFCLPLLKGKKVLDLACGEGYGTYLMSGEANEIIGVDIDETVIHHAEKKYKKANVQFIKADVQDLPFAKNLFDVVVSFETLEHITEHEKMLLEIKRVLKSDGVLIISTPNKEVYSHQQNFKNAFHQKELTSAEFQNLLKSSFLNTMFFFQQNIYGSFIYPANQPLVKLQESSGDFEHISAENRLANPFYFIAIAANAELPETSAFFFHATNIYEERFMALKNTQTYKLGNFLLAPVKWLREKFLQ